MISLDLADLVVIAGRTLGIETAAALDELDVAAAQAALAEARSTTTSHQAASTPSAAARAAAHDRTAVAAAGIGLVQALLRHRPFPRQSERVAVAAGLQFLALNGWRADLDPPTTAVVVVEALASGRLSQDNAAAWLSPRLSPRPGPAKSPTRPPLPLTRMTGSAPDRSRSRTLVGTALTLALGALAMLATACSQGHDAPAAPPPAHTTSTTLHSPASDNADLLKAPAHR